MTTPARPPLRDLILTALNVVIWTLRYETGYCADCIGGGPDGGPCDDHRGDAERLGHFEAARRDVADGGDILIPASTTAGDSA